MHFNQKIDNYRAPKFAILHPFLQLNDFTTILIFMESLKTETNAERTSESESIIEFDKDETGKESHIKINKQK